MLIADDAEPLPVDTLGEDVSAVPTVTSAQALEQTLLTRPTTSQGRRERRDGGNPGRARTSREERQQRRARRQTGDSPQREERNGQGAGRRRAARYQQLAAASEVQQRFRHLSFSSQVARFAERMESLGALLVSLQAAALPDLTGSGSTRSASNQNGGASTPASNSANESGRTAARAVQIQATGRRLAVPETTGHFLLGLLRNQRPEDVDGLRTPRARRLLSQLRRHLVSGSCFAGVSVAVGLWLFVRASFVLAASQRAECQGHMRSWLLTLILLQVSGPLGMVVAALVRRCSPHIGRRLLLFAWPISLVVLMVWTVVAFMYLSPPVACPPLRTVSVKAVALQSTSLLCMAISFLYLLAAHPIILRLNELVARGGILSEAASTIAEIPSNELPAKEECAICLGCVEDDMEEVEVDAEVQGFATERLPSFSSLASEEDLERGQALQIMESDEQMPTTTIAKPRPPWRRLKCGHRFHEQCLFQWLRKAKRCPLCRCHMREVPAWRRNHVAETATTASSGATGSQSTSSTSIVAPILQVDPSDASAESSGSADPRPMTNMVSMTSSSSCSSYDMVSPLPNVHSDSPSGCESQKGESS